MPPAFSSCAAASPAATGPADASAADSTPSFKGTFVRTFNFRGALAGRGAPVDPPIIQEFTPATCFAMRSFCVFIRGADITAPVTVTGRKKAGVT
eukprot:CAMPEP_0171967146 /NCGR_PEP_ID=MMETSP0993-20121228/196267_2 /TAXON_ID=483369 /ORGANISM="non described non described, Strain CCMP2098" /LENGTH=94 /DNA_ID=CAMNT_0012616579 /DNA_START=159 /DNA_END=439 /DNA_ORIENTATION=-